MRREHALVHRIQHFERRLTAPGGSISICSFPSVIALTRSTKYLEFSKSRLDTGNADSNLSLVTGLPPLPGTPR